MWSWCGYAWSWRPRSTSTIDCNVDWSMDCNSNSRRISIGPGRASAQVKTTIGTRIGPGIGAGSSALEDTDPVQTLIRRRAQSRRWQRSADRVHRAADDHRRGLGQEGGSRVSPEGSARTGAERRLAAALDAPVVTLRQSTIGVASRLCRLAQEQAGRPKAQRSRSPKSGSIRTRRWGSRAARAGRAPWVQLCRTLPGPCSRTHDDRTDRSRLRAAGGVCDSGRARRGPAHRCRRSGGGCLFHARVRLSGPSGYRKRLSLGSSASAARRSTSTCAPRRPTGWTL